MWWCLYLPCWPVGCVVTRSFSPLGMYSNERSSPTSSIVLLLGTMFASQITDPERITSIVCFLYCSWRLYICSHNKIISDLITLWIIVFFYHLAVGIFFCYTVYFTSKDIWSDTWTLLIIHLEYLWWGAILQWGRFASSFLHGCV